MATLHLKKNDIEILNKYKFSKRSLDNLNTCDKSLISLMIYALATSEIDFTVLCGHRNKEDQEIAFNKGNSQVHYPDSKHNSLPSTAVDIVPYPIPKTEAEWKDPEFLERFDKLAKHIVKVAEFLKIDIDGGFNWGWDLGHFQLD